MDIFPHQEIRRNCDISRRGDNIKYQNFNQLAGTEIL